MIYYHKDAIEIPGGDVDDVRSRCKVFFISRTIVYRPEQSDALIIL